MKRIGTTTDGSAIVEMTAADTETIKKVCDLLAAIGGESPAAHVATPFMMPGRAPAFPRMCKTCKTIKASAEFHVSGSRVCRACTAAEKRAEYHAKHGSKPAVKKVAASGSKVCSACGAQKPACDFYKGHGRCKPCLIAIQVKRKRAKAQAAGASVIERVSKARAEGRTFMPRERDPSLDRPVGPGCRVLPVGGGE